MTKAAFWGNTIGAVILSVGCSRAGQLGLGSQAGGWVRHQDPAGFTIQHPPGWRVETAEKAGAS